MYGNVFYVLGSVNGVSIISFGGCVCYAFSIYQPHNELSKHPSEKVGIIVQRNVA